MQRGNELLHGRRRLQRGELTREVVHQLYFVVVGVWLFNIVWSRCGSVDIALAHSNGAGDR
jgi:hypothetical protein